VQPAYGVEAIKNLSSVRPVTVIPKDALKVLVAERGVSEIELDALTLAIEGNSIATIAKQLQVREDAVRKRLGEVYRKFDIPGSGPGKLVRLLQLLNSMHQGSVSESPRQTLPQAHKQESFQDWKEAPDVSVFYGRVEELNTLTHWISQDRCRLIALLGMAGIGKTTLAMKLAKQLAIEMDGVMWRSLRHSPSVENLLDSLLQSLENHVGPVQPQETDKLSSLLNYLRQSRCLIILNGFEGILRKGDFVGHYQEGYRMYGEFLRRVAEEPHQSCLIFTSLEKPREISFLEGDTLPVRSLGVSGLEQSAAEEILIAKGILPPEADEWGRLIKIYRGNPLALKMISATIRDLFNQSVADFFRQQTTLIFRDIRELIGNQFNRLAALEQQILFWLATVEEPIPFEELKERMFLQIEPASLQEALGSLLQRSLLEKNEPTGSGFQLQPAVHEYVLTQLTGQIFEEICLCIETHQCHRMEYLRNYDLSHQENLSHHTAQDSNVLAQQVNHKLLIRYRSSKILEEHFYKLIDFIHNGISPEEIGYAVQNLQVLCQNLELEGKPFSNAR
jgi:hypothetical protein